MTCMHYRLPGWDVPETVKAFVFTRRGGVSAPPYDSLNPAAHVGDTSAAVVENRRRLASALPGAPAMQWLRQVHGTVVHRLMSAGEELEGDGLVTAEPGLACCVLTADCLPVFLADSDGGEVALAHAGWRGLSTGILLRAVATMRTPPERLRAWLGPAIGPCHFEVGEDVRDAFLSQAGESVVEESFRPGAMSGKYLADVYRLAHLQLTSLGITTIGGGDTCTVCDPVSFYSYRRDGATGRNLSVIYLSEN